MVLPSGLIWRSTGASASSREMRNSSSKSARKVGSTLGAWAKVAVGRRVRRRRPRIVVAKDTALARDVPEFAVILLV